MPERIITKPPSAELRPDQKDEDSLPPYPVLDGILTELIENETPVADIVAKGYDSETVLKVWRLLDRAEYKRRQAPPGVKLTSRSFGKRAALSDHQRLCRRLPAEEGATGRGIGSPPTGARPADQRDIR
ncbi:MAG: hypothetical protein ACMVO3_06060 [Thalassobaculum sp.]